MSVTPANVRGLTDSENRNYVAGATVTMGDAVYVDSTGKVQDALASAAATSQAIGIVTGVAEPGDTTALSGRMCNVTVFGAVGGFASLTPGAVYYVDPSTPGAITATPPTGSAKWASAIGYAESASVLFVNPGMVAAQSSSGV